MWRAVSAALLWIVIASGPALAQQAQAVGPGRGQIPGTATNDNAVAGNVGEFITSAIAQGAAVGLSTGVSANVTSISLTAGDWDVRATAGFHPAGTTTITQIIAGLSSSSATLPAPSDGYAQLGATLATGQEQVMGIAARRFSLSATTTVFLVVNSAFGASTMGGYGTISARRVR